MLAVLLLISLMPLKTYAGETDSLFSRLSMGASVAITVPSSSLLNTLRSTSENSFETANMEQDIEEKFSDNDVTVAIGCPIVYRPNNNIGIYGECVWFGFSNGNKWTPKTGDTIITTPRVHRYRFDFVTIGLGIQFNLPRDFITANDYSRLYLTAGGTAYPLLRSKMERTSTFGQVLDYTHGAGFKIGAGGEKRLSGSTKACGELSYEYSTFGKIKDMAFTMRRISFELKLLWGTNRFNQRSDGENR